MVVASEARGRDDDREAWREEASVIETMMGGGRGVREEKYCSQSLFYFVPQENLTDMMARLGKNSGCITHQFIPSPIPERVKKDKGKGDKRGIRKVG